MSIVSICFSGHPRVFLDYKEAWSAYFDTIRARHQLRVFFHCWSDMGLVRQQGGDFIEGSYEAARYTRFDELVAFLDPCAFQIQSATDSYEAEIAALGVIYVSSLQAQPQAILSQLHSIHLSNRLRTQWEAEAGPADVVMKLRFDLVPARTLLDEIDFIVSHPDDPVLFAPSPDWHRHQGGGGGCVECHAAFNASVRSPDFSVQAGRFLSRHRSHGNDICDLFAIASSPVMDRYCAMFRAVAELYDIVKADNAAVIDEYSLDQPYENRRIQRIVAARSGFEIENSPIFVPEKLIRANMRGSLVVHGENVFTIARR